MSRRAVSRSKAVRKKTKRGGERERESGSKGRVEKTSTVILFESCRRLSLANPVNVNNDNLFCKHATVFIYSVAIPITRNHATLSSSTAVTEFLPCSSFAFTSYLYSQPTRRPRKSHDFTLSTINTYTPVHPRISLSHTSSKIPKELVVRKTENASGPTDGLSPLDIQAIRLSERARFRKK